MTEKISQTLVNLTNEALELRHGVGFDEAKVGLPHQSEGQSAILDSLLRVRKRLDRVEEILSQSTRFKARLIKHRDDLRFEADFKLNEAIQKESGRRMDFQTGRERLANASLDAFEEKRKEYQADQIVAEAVMANEVIQQCYWGLNRLREDHLIILKSFQTYQTTIESLT